MNLLDFTGGSSLFIGPGFFLLIGASVVGLSALFSSNKGSGYNPPLDYDNRWPGYPRIPGDYGYSRFLKGRMGNLPAQRMIVVGLNERHWVDDEC